jgi:glutamate racemase
MIRQTHYQMMQQEIEMALGQEMALEQQRPLDLVKQHSGQVQLE